jgi:hypothetical protein
MIQTRENISALISELSLKLERVEKDYEDLLSQFGYTSDEIEQYLQNPANFSPEIWDFLKQEEKNLEKQLLLRLSMIIDPLKNQKTLSEQAQIQRNWIPVR